MLVLSRKINETIVVGDGDNKVVFTIVGIRGDHIRIGIEAPKTVPVHRGEVYAAIQRDGQCRPVVEK